MEYLTAAETAKLIRVQFKKAFPGQKFRVVSDTYAGGASIDISYIDGPKLDDVNHIISAFNGAEFDGMVDLKSYNKAWLMPDGSAIFAEYAQTAQTTYETAKPHPDAKLVSFGADFIFVNRSFSPAAIKVIQSIADSNNLPLPEILMRKHWANGKITEIDIIDWDVRDIIFNDREWYAREINDALKNTDFNNRPFPPTQAQTTPVEEIRVTWDRDWTWITFPKKPSESIRELIKDHFNARFSGKRQAWYITEQIDETTIKAQLAGYF
jgi:hypothetical protein